MRSLWDRSLTLLRIAGELPVIVVYAEKTLVTYQFFSFGISPRILAYQPGFWHISGRMGLALLFFPWPDSATGQILFLKP